MPILHIYMAVQLLILDMFPSLINHESNLKKDECMVNICLLSQSAIPVLIS